jgi:hypothetical protein
MLKKLLNEEIKKRDLNQENSKKSSEEIQGFQDFDNEDVATDNATEYHDEPSHDMENVAGDTPQKGWNASRLKAKKLQKSQERAAKKSRMKDVIRILILSKKIAEQINGDLQRHKNKKKTKDRTKELINSVAKILYLSHNHRDVDMMSKKITNEVISIANLMDAQQALCMDVLINSIRSNPSINPSVAMHLESLAQNTFAVNDGTNDSENVVKVRSHIREVGGVGR